MTKNGKMKGRDKKWIKTKELWQTSRPKNNNKYVIW